MKILLLHVDYIKFKPMKKALKSISEISENEKKQTEIKECLVVLTAVEKGDDYNCVNEMVKEVVDVVEKVGTKDIVLYPYAHLSSNLAPPEKAIQILDLCEDELKKKFKTWRAPFGYYKELELKVKGHPLSELSREIRVSSGKNEEEYDTKHLLKEISKSKLDISKLKENDHRILGRQMDLFSFNEVAPGMVFWHNNGLVLRNKLIDFSRELNRENNYEEIMTPQIMDKKLWQVSGHWEKYKENIFLSEYEKREFAIKPMNCPGGVLVFKNSSKSYKELPLRLSEFGIVHRQELSGVLGGLFRLIQFTQDDAHIFCTEEQLEGEINKIIDLTEFIYSKFNFKYVIEVSTRPEKRIGSEQSWNKAEESLKNVLEKRGIKYKINEGGGAFYGPKIDFHLKDSLERTWQCGTIQVDFSMPERFELEYTDKDNNKKRPIMIHRAIYGSLERFIGILLEHTKGRLPLWLAPIQIRVLSFTDRNKKYAQEIFRILKKEIKELRIETDFKSTTISSKVRNAEIMKIPYIIVVGDKEEKNKKIALRIGGNSKIKTIKMNEFIKKIKKEIDEKSMESLIK